MKRQKRILAGASAMLLALGMLIGCDTPANSGSSDGGSTGGSITLPEGDSTAESKLEGTWVQEDNDTNTHELKADKTWKNDNDKGTWSATKTVLFFFIKETGSYPMSVVLNDDDKLQIPMLGSFEFERKSGSEGSIEGIWEMRYDDEIIAEIIQCTIGKDSFEVSDIITSKTSSAKTERKTTGSREDNTLTPKEVEQIESLPYILDGNTLTLSGTTYKRQQ